MLLECSFLLVSNEFLGVTYTPLADFSTTLVNNYYNNYSVKAINLTKSN